MLYRRFGLTELEMPVFSCGGMRYHHQWSDLPLSEVPKDNQRNLEATVRRSVELGINHIETARGYGSSERQLGVVLPTFPRDEIIVQTKIAPHADPLVFVEHFNESLERLNLDHVDLLALHGVNTAEHLWHAIRPGGCLEAARRLQRDGKARHIGFSTHAPLPLILDAIKHTGPDDPPGFDYINLHWYWLFQDNWPAVQAAAERDMGVFIISPSDKGGMLYSPPDRMIELCDPLHPLVFNCVFCLNRPEVHTLSLGASCPSDFDLQLTSLPLLKKADELLPPIVERLRKALVDAVGEDLADRFNEGVPSWENAPGYMNIDRMLWLRNIVLAYDLVEFGKMRYNLLGEGGHWWPGLNAAHVDEWDLGKALKHSPYHDHIPDWLREVHEMLGGEQQKRLSQS
ncbi:MAG: aldo/keto reductase [Phycisphaera sp.]|nr:aldo/keto reductase [Phycisphaera sp.]